VKPRHLFISKDRSGEFMETLEAILTRKSIREYTNQAVPDNLVQELLAAAMQAPSAGNQQPWHFIIVTERKQLDALADVSPFGKMLKESTLGIVVCADLELEKYPGFWVQDCSNATMSLLLAAHDRGLGAVWVAVYPVEDRVMNYKQILGLPAPVIPLCIVPIGYPAARPEPPTRRFNKTRLHHNHW
jgi:nitroreductase